MSLTAPYSNSMRLGQGFNTYTQEIRIENAVKIKSPASASAPVSTADLVSAHVEARLNTNPSNTIQQNGHHGEIDGILATSFKNEHLISNGKGSQLTPSIPDNLLPFSLPKAETPKSSQSVTYSTRAIDNVSDIMDALNISTAMSIKYGTIHGNASAGFVNEAKVLDSQLNYVVTVKVNNESTQEPQEMDFQPIEGLPADKFTEVYGDSFISGFLQGGEFNAIISVDVHDRSKLRSVKQAIDIQLAVGPSPISIGAKEAVEKKHAEVLQDTEITISVNWSGGGEIKRPEIPWTLTSVIQVANAFPSLVAHCSAKTSAILTRYSSLRSFQTWLYKMIEKDSRWGAKDIILNYAPCAVYTADLFDALMSYKKIWKRIDFIMSDMSKWKVRDSSEKKVPTLPTVQLHKSMASLSGMVSSPVAASPVLALNPSTAGKEQTGPVDLTEKENPQRTESPNRTMTFGIDDPYVEAGWDLELTNCNRSPIPLEPYALNEARLLCREAMTLITEEAARLVDHASLAYAVYDPKTKKTRMKRPNYAYPEVLRARLPVFIRNDAANDSFSRDAAAIKVQFYSHNNDLWCQLVGDNANPHRKYAPFASLDFNEGHAGDTRPLTGLSLHAYHHHSLVPGHFSKDANNAIGAIGFRFSGDKDVKADNCSFHSGKPRFEDSSKWRHLDLRPSLSKISPASDQKLGNSSGLRADNSQQFSTEIIAIDISYVPGTGRIAGLAFFDKFGEATTERLGWKQWTAAGLEPEGLKVVKQIPPVDGQQWRFVGIMGDWDESIWGTVLSRVSGIWRRV